jgi:hypothetical protein
MSRLNLVDEAHRALKELSAARHSFQSGKMGSAIAGYSIGFFNATSRALTTAIWAERWYQQKKNGKKVSGKKQESAATSHNKPHGVK